MKRWLLGWLLLITFGVSFSVSAQGTCPADVLLALSRAFAACSRLERNQVCYGSGSSMANSPFEIGSFAQPGDIVPLVGLASVYVQSAAPDTYSVALLKVQANLPSAEQRSVTMFAIGNVYLENPLPPQPEIPLTARGTVNVRALPNLNSEIIERVAIGGVLIANGRAVDAESWLRVVIPNTDIVGWVSMETVTPDGDIGALTPIAVDEPLRRPFDEFALRTGANDAPCDGAPPSGLLMQTPNTAQEVHFVINQTDVWLAGTVFLQATPGESLVINVLDGQARLAAFGTAQWIPAGARVRLPLGENALASAAPLPAEPYTLADVQFTPYAYLDARFRLPDPLTEDQIAAFIADVTAPVVEATEIVETEDICRYVVQSDQNVRTGPGTNYAVAYTVDAGDRVYPRSMTTTPDETVWLEVGWQGWLRAQTVESEGTCDPLPDAQYIVQPGTNTLTLESCAADSEPIRPGQRVTIQFVPPAWRTFAHADDATYSDKGRIYVGDTSLRVSYTEPIKLSESRFIRRFSAEWIAEAGTFRIVGEHHSYQIICNVTVLVASEP